MAQLGTTFNAATVPTYEPGTPVWEGRVPMQIMRTEIKATAANDGQNMLVLHVQALDLPYKGQDNAIRLNLYNRNAMAVDIAQRQLSSICHVTGRMTITDADQLIGAPFLGIWEKESREITDQATGQKRTIDGCQCRNFAMIDGRTIKEALAGQAASNPYVPGVSGVQEAAARGGAVQQPQQPHAPQPPVPQQQPQGFGGPPQAQPGFQQGNAPQAGFAPPAPAMAQGGAPQGQAPQPGFGTAASGSNGQQGGFAPPAPQAAPQQQGGFQPPQPGAGGAGPWAGGGGAPGVPQGGFGVR